jgi:hypothetical protein
VLNPNFGKHSPHLISKRQKPTSSVYPNHHCFCRFSSLRTRPDIERQTVFIELAIGLTKNVEDILRCSALVSI